MKTVVMMLVFVSGSAAMAWDYIEGTADQVPATYLSWCDHNSVIAQDSNGNLFVRANCSESGLQCKTSQIYRAQGSVVSASCVRK